MKTFIVAVPLFNADMTVTAYRLSDRNGEKLFGTMDDFREFSDSLQTPGLELVEKLGIEPFAGNAPLFVDVNQFQLLMGIPANMNLAVDKLVCVIPGRTKTDDEAVLDRCAQLKHRGYKLALDRVPLTVRRNPFMEIADYIFIDYKSSGFESDMQLLKSSFSKATIVFTGIPDMKTFDKFLSVKSALFSGAFYSDPITKDVSDLSPLKVNALRLLKQVSDEEFDLLEIAATIEQDPSLSISLLKFINSSVTGIKRKIESIRSAVAILGQREVKRWATVAISVQLADDSPGEIAKLSLIRAKFAENLATSYELGVFAPSLFMAGLFSLLNVILKKPMDQAINEVAVNERVHMALVDRKGELYEVLDLIYAYEKADWDGVSINLIRNNVDVDAVTDAFISTLVWYKELLDSMKMDTLTASK